jgi:cytoskeletal protein RodZ
MPESFGARLRQQREERGIALATIAQQTRIKEALLEALERDDVSQWPSGLYRRAFFRAYARAIGTDPDKAMQEFATVHPEPEIDVLKAMASTLERTEGSRMTAGIRDVVGSAIGTLSRLRRGTPASEVTSAPPSSMATPPPVMTPEALGNDWVEPAINAEPAAADPTQRSASPSADECVQKPPTTSQAAVELPPPAPPAPVEPPAALPPQPVAADVSADLFDLARVCTDLARTERADDARLLMQDVARLLDANGIILWRWDHFAAHLYPAVVHGYSDKQAAQLPCVRPDAPNATAAAFRACETRVIAEDRQCPAALVVPIQTSMGCAGVLAIELRRGRAPAPPVIALAVIIAAQLAPVVRDNGDPGQLPLTRVAVGAVAQGV